MTAAEGVLSLAAGFGLIAAIVGGALVLALLYSKD